MITAATFRDIVAVYTQHGWLLRRVLLSPELRKELNLSIDGLEGDVALFDSEIDAAWFSRPPKTGRVPWEIRHLSNVAYARLYTIDEHEADFEEAMTSAENEFRQSVSSRKAA